MRVLMIVGLLASLGLVAGEPLGKDLPPDLASRQEQIKDLFWQVSTINLLNGLRLTREQTQEVLALAQKAKAARTEPLVAGRGLYTRAMDEALASYRAFKDEAQKGEPPTGQISNRAVRAERRLKDALDAYYKQCGNLLRDLDAQLQRTLTPSQLEIIEGFKPCLIPPQDLRDPVRAGQAASQGPVNMLAHLRRMPEREWQARREKVAEFHLNMVEKHHYKMLNEAERNAEKKRLLSLLDKARSMSDTDFELAKGELAASFRGEDKRETLMTELRDRQPHGAPRLSKASQFLLNEAIIDILRERLAAP
jgi:hypothetical protein